MRHEWDCIDSSGERLTRAVDSDGLQVYRYPGDNRWRPTSGDPRAYREEILRLAEENSALKATIAGVRDALPMSARLGEVTGFDRIAADRLADEVASLVANRHLDSRSAAADALLDYRNPPRTKRSDRLAALEAEVERLREMHLPKDHSG